MAKWFCYVCVTVYIHIFWRSYLDLRRRVAHGSDLQREAVQHVTTQSVSIMPEVATMANLHLWSYVVQTTSAAVAMMGTTSPAHFVGAAPTQFAQITSIAQALAAEPPTASDVCNATTLRAAVTNIESADAVGPSQPLIQHYQK